MSQPKAGLHKDVSEIFNGMSPPGNSGGTTAQVDGAPAQEKQDYTNPKPSAPSHMTPTKPKSGQPFSKENSPVKKRKSGAGAKTIEKLLKNKIVQDIKSKLLAPKEGISPTRQKVTIVVVPILFVVLIVMFIRAFGTPSGTVAKPLPSGPTKPAADDSDSEVVWQAPQPYPTTLRDPMQFGSATTEAGGGLAIKGIVFSKDKPTAIIGNNIVHEGDKILDVTVIKINEDSVEFEANNKRWMQQVER